MIINLKRLHHVVRSMDCIKITLSTDLQIRELSENLG